MGEKTNKLALAIVTAFAATSCSRINSLQNLEAMFIQNPSQTAVTVNFCTDPAMNQQIVQKTLVILDHSGSNQLNYLMASDGSGDPAIVNGDIIVSKKYATDPTGFLRYGSINTPNTLLNYLSNLPTNNPQNPQFWFALVDFSSTATPYPSNGTSFTSDTKAFFNYVVTDAGGYYPKNSPPNDTGYTSYLSALTTAYNIINGDIQSAQACAALPFGSKSPGAWCPNPGVVVSSYYTIVFASDGDPITNIQGVTLENGQYVVTGPLVVTRESTSDILAQEGAIMALKSNKQYVGGMNLFTLYYYVQDNVDLAGQYLLGEMAQAGNGIAYDLVAGSSINYQNFLPSSKQDKFTLEDIFVTNSSVVMENDGLPHADTDMDGIPDDVEVQLGLNPAQSDTFNLGISDLTLYRMNGNKPCKNKNAKGICTDPLPNISGAGGICSNLSQIPVKGQPGKFTYASSDPDGLNDCEKLALADAGGIGNPDSNGDVIPDWMELKSNVAFQLGTAPQVNSPGQDGWSIYNKIKDSVPVGLPVYELLNFSPANYNTTLLSSTPTQDCYVTTVTNLPVFGNSNTVRVDVLLQDKVSGNTRYKIGKKQFPAGSLNLNFNDWNDPGEAQTGTWSQWQ